MGSEDGQNSDSKKECLTIKQDNNASAISAFNGPSIPMTSTSETEGDQQNTPPEDVLVITISGTCLGSNGDRHAKFEEAPDIEPISSSDSFIREMHKVITLEDEPTDSGSETEVMSCHVAAGIKEETTISSTSANVEDLVEGMKNLFSQQEEVLAI
ncbi:hypothetical protein AAC387_Pa10g0835 [Persea americana]